MITLILVVIWLLLVLVPIVMSTEADVHWPWLVWLLAALLWIVPIFTGVHVENSQGQYKGYVTAVEQNGAIFRGWNVYLKTELESSDADVACIDRENPELIAELQKAQENKENVTLEYVGVWQYAIGECPGKDWMIVNKK